MKRLRMMVLVCRGVLLEVCPIAELDKQRISSIRNASGPSRSHNASYRKCAMLLTSRFS